jgi:hypothetical protein
MSIVTLLVVLLIAGFILYMLMTAPIPIHPWVRSLITGILIITLVIWLLQGFGLDTGFRLR